MTELERTRPKPQVRALHLGLGSFFRAHQAWYTQHAEDGGDWGIAAFAGRGGLLAQALRSQDSLYVLDVRAPDGDEFEVIEALAAVHDADDREAWIGYWSDPDVQCMTLTVTEAGYRRGAAGGLDQGDQDVVADLRALHACLKVGERGVAEVSTACGRIVAGLLARRAVDAGPFTIVPCDNLPRNAAALSDVVDEMAALVDPTLVQWMGDNLTYVSTAVDRITPATTDADRERITAATGIADVAPVVTEPFREWVLGGTFAGQRPEWETAGATIVDDTAPYEARKLTLLNGSHSLLAYAGPLRGHATVSEAISDDASLEWVNQWWDEACRHLPMPQDVLAHYREALLERYANPAIQHRLAQIAMDGSLKLPVRILPTVRAERAAGRVPRGGGRVLAAWALSIRQPGGPAADPRSAELIELAEGPLEEAVPRLIGALDPALGKDAELVAAVVALAEGLQR